MVKTQFQRRTMRKPGGNRPRMNGNQATVRKSRAPVATSTAMIRPTTSGRTILRGKDFLGNAVLRATTSSVSDKVLKVMDIAPQAFIGTRLTQLAGLWERYRFKKCHLQWVPAIPTSISAQLCLYLDTDPDDDPLTITDPEALVRQATAAAGSRQWNAWESMTAPLVQRKDDQFYYTSDSSESRLSRQARAYLIQVTDPVSALGQVLDQDISGGVVYIDWEIEFDVPQVDTSATVRALSAPASTEVTSFTNVHQETIAHVETGANDLRITNTDSRPIVISCAGFQFNSGSNGFLPENVPGDYTLGKFNGEIWLNLQVDATLATPNGGNIVQNVDTPSRTLNPGEFVNLLWSGPPTAENWLFSTAWTAVASGASTPSFTVTVL